MPVSHRRLLPMAAILTGWQIERQFVSPSSGAGFGLGPLRTFLITVAAIVIVARVSAAQAPCHPASPTERVTVTTADGRAIRGTLLCITGDAARLAVDGVIAETPLSEIRRIETRADPVWDGAIKGAAFPLILWAVLSHETGSLGWTMRSAAAWGLIGTTFDALQTNRKTIYTGGTRTVSIAWRVRF